MTLKIYIIAGEASGDALGAKLMRALKTIEGNNIEFYGIGGPQMQAQGFDSLFPMEELSLIGFVEILPHARQLLNRIKETANDIIDKNTDVIITIDSPGFNFRIAQHKLMIGANLIHYVAPTVWAYKPERAAKIAKLYKHLLVLLPFEPPYFEKEGLPTTFVGHPMLEDNLDTGDGETFRRTYDIPADVPLLCVLPGSRKGELKRLLPIYEKAITQLQTQFANLHAVILATERFKNKLSEITENWPLPTVVVTGKDSKRDAMAASTVALAKSGTGTLELAVANVPMIVAYRVNPISAWMLRRMIKVQYVNLINIILDKPVIPELLQEQCSSDNLFRELSNLLESENKREEQRKHFAEALSQLGQDQSPTPSEKAAKVVLEQIPSKAWTELKEGDRVSITGGYERDHTTGRANWQGDHDEYFGTVLRFLPSQEEQPFAVVKLDTPISHLEKVKGNILALKLRHKGAQWRCENTVHLSLFDTDVSHIDDIDKGEWIESHASYRQISA